MKSFSKKANNLILFTALTGFSFYLGVLIYPYTLYLNKEVRISSVKEFSSDIDRSVAQDLILNTGSSNLTIKSSELKKWVEPYTRYFSGKQDKRLSGKLMALYLESIAPSINKEPVNAKLKFQSNKAEIFVPSSPGKKINIVSSVGAINSAIITNAASVSLIYDQIEPEVTLEKINNLGIKDLLAKGESDYGKSHASRINNIKVGMAKFNGIILKPGEEFSFNHHLGEVEASVGYQAELVIKNGQLEKEFGGGLCQVSTTVFRAAIMAGFPILERKPHSFPVQYYNPQGFDSTIYPGVVDLRFKNNTENHVLIQTKVSGSRLSVEIYGTRDGRKVTVDGPYQYDKQPSGAMKAYFTRKISNGEQLAQEERFDSIYKAPPPSPLEKNPLE